MGRWGDGIYDSDASLDFFDTIMDRISRDISFWFSPEQVDESAEWLREVLTLIEIRLIFDVHEIGTTVDLIYQEAAVKRWQDTFFKVWDAQWDDAENTDSPYHVFAYRVKYRWIVSEWFTQLTNVVNYWLRLSKASTPKLTPFVPTEKLPFLSITRLKTDDDREYYLVGSSVEELLDFLIQKIVFIFSEESREKALGIMLSDIEATWVAADVIRILCQEYEIAPGLTEKTIQRWQDTITTIWSKQGFGKVDEKTSSNTLYYNIIATFDQLKRLAQQYPVWDAL